MAQQIIIKGTPVTAANEVLVADSNSKIPAVDGSQVTAMSGTNVGTGTVATARLDTGTTANKIVILDGSARLPVVDGSLLTGIVSYTKSASDPTVSTNPSGGVGTEWVNTSTGKQFICTDATAGANVWSCSGSHSGNIEPVPWWPGESYGYNAGGQNNANNQYPINNIHRFSFTTDGSSTDIADMIQGLRYVQSTHSTIAGYVMGGTTHDPSASPGTGPRNDIQKFIYATEANMTDVGDVPTSGEGAVGVSSITHGYRLGGGHNTGGTAPYGRNIEKWAFSTDGNATDVADMLTYSYLNTAVGNVSDTHGYIGGGGGHTGAPYNWSYVWDTIQKMPFASDSNAVDSGQDLIGARSNQANLSSDTHGYCTGGRSMTSAVPPLAGYTTDNVIQKFPFASSSNATDVGDMTVVRNMHSGTSSHTYGYSTAGYTPYTNVIDKVSFASGGNATDVGDINITSTNGPGYGAGCFHK